MFPVARNPYPLVHSSLSRLLPFMEQADVQDLIDYTTPLTNAANVTASQQKIGMFVCPSDGAGGFIPGILDAGTNYVANNGSGTVDYGLIASGDGLFTQKNLGFSSITDGSSNTAMFSESILGTGIASTTSTPLDYRREVLEIPGGADTTPAACESAAGVWSGKRGGKWIDGHYGNSLYNHYYTPNPKNWGCGNGSHNKGLSTARSSHAGGVEICLCDGSVRFIANGIDLVTWRALATRQGGEVAALP